MEIRQKQPAATGRDEPPSYCDFWEKYDPAKLRDFPIKKN